MYLCIDIGTNSIKALEKDSNGAVVKWGVLERKDRPFHTRIAPLNEVEAIYFLKILLEKMGHGSGEAVVTLPDFLIFTMIADAPDDKNIPAAPGTFHFQAFELTPLAPGRAGGQARKFFLVAVPNDVVEKYERILRAVGLGIRSIELESFVLARLWGQSKTPILIVNLGNRSTSIIVAQDGFPYFISQTDFAVASGMPDVIINKVQEIAGAEKVKNVVYSRPFDLVNGL